MVNIMNPDMLKRIQELQDVNDVNFVDYVKLKEATAFYENLKKDEKPKKSETPYSVKVLEDCIDLQLRKSKDYQNPKSRIRQADHYPRGCQTILDMVHQKITRMYSVIEAMESDECANFESLEDSAMDAINYLSFFVSYSRGQMDGQSPDRNLFNRKVKP